MVKKIEYPKKKWQKKVKKMEGIFPSAFLNFLESKKSIFEVEVSEEIHVLADDTNELLLLEIGMDTRIRIPSIQMLRMFSNEDLMPKIWTDAGATRFILNGADLMRPGITKVDSFLENEFVQVVNPQGNVLAIHKAKFSSEEIMKKTKGKVTSVTTYLNDEIWNLPTQL